MKKGLYFICVSLFCWAMSTFLEDATLLHALPGFVLSVEGMGDAQSSTVVSSNHTVASPSDTPEPSTKGVSTRAPSSVVREVMSNFFEGKPVNLPLGYLPVLVRCKGGYFLAISHHTHSKEKD